MEHKVLAEFKISDSTHLSHLRKVLAVSGYDYIIQKIPSKKGSYDYRITITEPMSSTSSANLNDDVNCMLRAVKICVEQIRTNEKSYKFISDCYHESNELLDYEIIREIGYAFNNTFDVFTKMSAYWTDLVKYIVNEPVLIELYAGLITDPEEKKRYNETGQIDANHLMETFVVVLDRAMTSFHETVQKLTSEVQQLRSELPKSDSNMVEGIESNLMQDD